MRFSKTPLDGACIIDIERLEDSRGFFARSWCEKEFLAMNLEIGVAQANISFNYAKGTLRGLHWQVSPHAETKLVRCTKGAIFDVIVDLRPESETYRQWFGVELSAENHKMLFVPENFAHGFQTLEDDSEVFYQVSEFYAQEFEMGARYNDPEFAIEWPLEVTVVSDKDASWPDFLES